MAWRSLPPGIYRGFWESYKTEIAAYELDKLLKMDMVPPTVERQLQGIEGAAQLWVEKRPVRWKATRRQASRQRVDWENQLVRMTMFDNLIGNRDRNRAKHAARCRVEPDSARSFARVRGRHRAPAQDDAESTPASGPGSRA